MKKLLFILSFFLFISNSLAEENKDLLNLSAKAAIMIESTTGEILYSKNCDEKMPPASMTKMMSLLIIMEKIEDGSLKWDEIIETSESASSMGGSQIFLKPGEKMTVKDLVKGISIASANDATVLLAERIAGSEDAFVKMMNDKANLIGLKNTNFVTSTGLDSDNHYSSAKDMAIIAKNLLKHKEILKFTSTYEDYLRTDTKSPFWLVNTNRLVKYYDGMDGLKTGFTSKSGYCLTGTAKRDGMRLITVVMNERSPKERNSDTTKLLDYGFNSYMVRNIIDENSIIKNVPVELSNIKNIDIISKENITILNKKTDKKRNLDYKINLDYITAPVKKGDTVGTIDILEDGKVIAKVDATVKKDIPKANIFKIYLRNLLQTFNPSFN